MSGEEQVKMLEPHTAILVNDKSAILQFEQENPVQNVPPIRNNKKLICFVVGLCIISVSAGFAFYLRFSAGNTTTKPTADFTYNETTLSPLSSTTLSQSPTTLSQSAGMLSHDTTTNPVGKLSNLNITSIKTDETTEPDYGDDTTEIILPSSPKPNKYDGHRNYHKFPRACGESIAKDRIQNGDKAQLFEHPWMVVIIHKERSTGNSYTNCGGSLVNDRIILSASHCVVDEEKYET